MADFDIFAPQISAVSYDMGGKSLMLYGSNRVGKTKNMCALPKPCYLMFENGLNAISGVPFFRMDDWKTFVQFVKQITDPKNAERAHEMYQTIIIDTAEIMGNLCATYVCNKFGMQSLGEKKYLPGTTKIDYTFSGYKELDKENRKWLNKLLNAGYTVAYIAHEGTRDFKDENGDEYTKIVPRGDKRVMDAICDAVDIIAYVVPNGLDDNGNEIKSSLVLANSKKALAGSRFDYLAPYLAEFTADNLVNAVKEAVKKEEEMSGNIAVSFEEQAKTREVITTNKSHDELVSEIGTYAQKLFNEQTGEMDPRYINIIEEYLGKGASVQKTTSDQNEQLEMILFDLKHLFN